MALNDAQKKERAEYLENALKITDCSKGEPYAFVSYASDNWEKVFKDGIVPLQKEYGLRVYADKAFDEVNHNWTIPMFRNICGAEVVISFVSQSYIESYACFLELLIAVNNQKPIVFVYLDNDLNRGPYDRLDVEPNAKSMIMKQGDALSTITNNTSSDIMRAMSSAFAAVSILLETDNLSKFDITNAFVGFFRNAGVNRKTLNDLVAVKRTIGKLSAKVFDRPLEEGGQKTDGKSSKKVILRTPVTRGGKTNDSINVFGADSGSGRGSVEFVDVYEGEVKDGLKHGYGIMKYLSGNVYEGEWKDDKKNGKGTLKYAIYNGTKKVKEIVHEGEWKDDIRNGPGVETIKTADKVYVFKGEWKDDIRNGQFTVTFPNGDVYEGGLYGTSASGQGVMKYASGDVYEGNWKNGKKSGQGVMKYANGDVYEGNWENGYQSGQGVMTYADGSVYKGEWKNGKPNGRCAVKYADGNMYVGDMKDGVPNGNGIMKYANGEVREGVWADGKLDARGAAADDGSFYTGETKDGVPNGHGEMRYADGSVYEGEWKDGVPDGQGTINYANGEVYNGEWENGKRSGRGVLDYPPNVHGLVSYDGEWENDAFNGKGTLRYCDSVWEGHFKEGRVEEAAVTFDNGNVIKGLWEVNEEGQSVGRGTIEFANGAVYTGSFDGIGRRSGYGVMKYANGDVFDGKWRDDKPSLGTLTYANGDVYEGGVLGKLPHGFYGTMKYANGDVFTGGWSMGKKDGEGVLTHKGKDKIGKWKNDKYIGKS